MTRPTILVAGLGRCGTSLVMQMLAAAGVPTIGTFPAFEDDLNMRLPALDAQREFVGRCAGRAIKLLDPHLHAPPVGLEYRTIFLSRHPVEQAKSTLKLLDMPRDRSSRRAMEHAVRRDTGRARSAVARIGDGRFLHLSFENLIHDPTGSAQAIVRLVASDFAPLDAEVMAAVVRRRPATCLPYMLELELLQNA